MAKREVTGKLFKGDAIERAKRYLGGVGSTGAYSHSQGIPIIRQDVAKFIEARDGYPSNADHIFLTAGASPAVQLVLQTLIAHQNVGIMIPIPQYPLYTASIDLFNGKAVPYYLDEEKDWGMSVEELKRALKESRDKGVEVKALCCLSEENMKEIITFCQAENLALLADEVYQTNIYMPASRPFHSFKKVLKSMGPAYSDFELVSFHSVSKGMIGECGRRGGYFECTDRIYLTLSPRSRSNMVGLMTNPPKPGDESYAQYDKEIKTIYSSLARRAESLAKALNELEGVTCNPAQGAMYLFPQITLPKKAVEEARKQGREPDDMYLCVVPGSGFLQKEGTFHFRSTFLAPEDQMQAFADNLASFHKAFMKKYKD
ncbi:pyridoxal phosphate-dependent transferase [Chytridium lagenaria]|nr:pyridoxal phosphate-dependent transferase [Chytridium lagenaria]